MPTVPSGEVRAVWEVWWRYCNSRTVNGSNSGTINSSSTVVVAAAVVVLDAAAVVVAIVP